MEIVFTVNVLSLVGLGIYGSESESSDNEEDKSDKEDSSGVVDSEAEIRVTLGWQVFLGKF